MYVAFLHKYGISSEIAALSAGLIGLSVGGLIGLSAGALTGLSAGALIGLSVGVLVELSAGVCSGSSLWPDMR
jgi:hypothetical protein